jgi:hypothetical protein
MPRKNSPKSLQTEPTTDSAPESVQTPAPAKKTFRVRPDNLTPADVKAWSKFKRDSIEIERQWWSITRS